MAISSATIDHPVHPYTAMPPLIAVHTVTPSHLAPGCVDRALARQFAADFADQSVPLTTPLSSNRAIYHDVCTAHSPQLIG